MPHNDLIFLGTGFSRQEYPGYVDPQKPGMKPAYDVEAAVWGVNNGFLFTRKMQKLFIVDTPRNVILRNVDFNLVQQSFGCELISSCPIGLIPVTLYPVLEIMEYFRTKYFTNTVCYMMAYALWLHDWGVERYDRWFMYGMDMVADGEYYKQIPGMTYWIGEAKARGIDVVNTEFSAVGKVATRRLYGHWEPELLEKMNKLAEGFSV